MLLIGPVPGLDEEFSQKKTLEKDPLERKK